MSPVISSYSLRLIAFFLVFTCFFLLGCGKREGKSQTEKAPPKVSIITIEPKDIPANSEYVAQTQSSHLVNIQARVNGFLEKRVYTEGDVVKKGQILFIMDKKPFQAQVDAAEAAVSKQKAALDVARRNLARVKPLAEQNALSQKDLDDAIGSDLTTQASLEEAKAKLETALLNLSYCTISSPIDGITSSAIVQEGTYLNIGNSQLTTVSALSPIWVNFSLSENQLQNYRDLVASKEILPPPNEKYDVIIIQVNNEIFPYTGKITFAEPYFNSQTGTFLIRSSVYNPDAILRPNQYVRVRVEGAIRPNAILVPQRSIQESSKGHFVWIVNSEEKVEQLPVNVGDWYGNSWIITSGLRAGDRVVVDGVVTLHDGMSVSIKKESE